MKIFAFIRPLYAVQEEPSLKYPIKALITLYTRETSTEKFTTWPFLSSRNVSLFIVVYLSVMFLLLCTVIKSLLKFILIRLGEV